ncbi:glucosamine-6-phosphate deaminase [Sporosarcina sp. PTS2304]|uniref:glucosamine-6-phosphate deaminase n=1 Tax=Sporosarcina sp. PTS2304 TaxID=2283194 RepID=UPI000E0D1923|nr:glucosamine-6-phosphate deaminase [Sporosarcina sp. PTS2304]AXH99760.1 glucosamine-6-phosphate deaminase [Sporosarcina sp. PTS2304]
MENLNLIRTKNPHTAANVVTDIIKEKIDNGFLNVIGLATGQTMIPIYNEWIKNEDLSFENIVSFNLDEYVGISTKSSNSYTYFMNEYLFKRKKFKESFIPDGMAENVNVECEQYESLIDKYPIDLIILGVGENGHIAFNEPGSPSNSLTHVAKLSDSTKIVNGKYFNNRETIPETAITMGIGTILKAKSILLVAFGEKKRAAINKLLEGKLDSNWPITYLLEHDEVTIVTDIV